jgi:hypothetical protein
MSKRHPSPEITGARTPIPPWLSNPDLAAPCPCGQPADPEMPNVLATSNETGLTRWFHAICWHNFMHPQYMDDDDD